MKYLKKLPYWIKSGLIGLVIYTVVCIGILIYSFKCSGWFCWPIVFFIAWPWIFIEGTGAGYIFFMYIIFNIILSFSLGAIIAVLYKKIKSMKKLPYWLKGGLIGLAIYIVLSIILIIYASNCDGFFCGLVLVLIFLPWAGLFGNIDSGVWAIIYVILNIVTFFAIGALIAKIRKTDFIKKFLSKYGKILKIIAFLVIIIFIFSQWLPYKVYVGPVVDRIELCEVEDPRFNAREECQKIIYERYPNKNCSFELGPTEYMDFGSCRDCIIKCE